MLSRDEFGRLARLLNNLHLCTGIKFALMDENGCEVYTSSDRTSFCSAVRQEGGLRVLACCCGLGQFTSTLCASTCLRSAGDRGL